MRTAIDPDHAVLSRALRGAPELMRLLALSRSLSLPQAYIAAGTVRNTYWAQRHGFSSGYAAADVDLVFFDPYLPKQRDREIARELQLREPLVVWDVTNQAHVHTWYEAYTGVRLAPLSSTAAGIALWPETATCVGARLDSDDEIEIVSPCGLTDLLSLRWCPNPSCPDPGAFARRCAEKRVSHLWPMVQVVSV